MQETKIASLLNDEIERYYADKKHDMSQVAKYICDSILAGVDCDSEKLLSAIKSMKMSRDRQNFSDAQNNQIYDISTETSKVIVRQVFDNGNMIEPVLLFFKNDETLPFFKIIPYFENGLKNIVVETSNNSVMLAKIKEKINTVGYNYIFKDQYTFKDENKVLAKKHLFAKSGIELDGENALLNDFSDEEKLFFAFIGQIVGKTYSENSTNLNFDQAQMLKYFYETMQSVFTGNNEFEFDDLIKILVSLYFNDWKFNLPNNGLDNNGLSVVAENIAMRTNSNNNLEFQTLSKSGKPLTIKVDNAHKYSLIEIYDEKGSELLRYMIYQTDRGFTLFRSIRDSSQKNKNILDSCTLNLTDNILNFSAMGDNKILPTIIRPIDVQVKFKKSGEFLLSSTLAAELENKNLEYSHAGKINN